MWGELQASPTGGKLKQTTWWISADWNPFSTRQKQLHLRDRPPHSPPFLYSLFG